MEKRSVIISEEGSRNEQEPLKLVGNEMGVCFISVFYMCVCYGCII
jgi:hypothetical protein